MVRVKNKIISIFLCVILSICLFSGCTPTSISNSYLIFDSCSIINEKSSLTIDNDEYGRVLGCAYSKDKDGQDVYVVLQSYYGDGKEEMSFLKGNYYFFDYECKGQESEEFKQFLEDNLWNSPIKASNEQLLYGLQKEDAKMKKFANDFNWYDDNMKKYINYVLNDFGISNNSINSYADDNYLRIMIGVNVPPTTAGNQPKLYALMFQATTNSACYHFADRCVTEIRLDHYVEDLEAFKKANNWDEPLTVEDLNAMDKYIVSGSGEVSG